MSQDLYSSFHIHESFPTADLQRLLIGTDGVIDLEEAAEKPIPGKKELVGPVDQFWDDKYFKNAVALDRRLHTINREVSKLEDGHIRTHTGLLSDDTTVVLIRDKEWKVSEEG